MGLYAKEERKKMSDTVNIEQIKWDENTDLIDIIGEDINTTTSIDQKIIDINSAIVSIQNDLANLKTLMNSTDISILKQDVTTLKTQSIPVTKIQWDVSPVRNLKQVLGNLDNLPYSNLRLWLQQLEKKTVWEKISPD